MSALPLEIIRYTGTCVGIRLSTFVCDTRRKELIRICKKRGGKWDNTKKAWILDTKGYRAVMWDLGRWRDLPGNAPEICGKRFNVGHVYFIQGLSNEWIKIGFSKQPLRRLDDLQAGSPTPLRIIKTVPGDMSLERKLHHYFSEYRKHGEWFDISEEDVYKALAEFGIPLVDRI